MNTTLCPYFFLFISCFIILKMSKKIKERGMIVMQNMENKNNNPEKNVFETKRINKFIDHQMPALITAINRLAAAIENNNGSEITLYANNQPNNKKGNKNRKNINDQTKIINNDIEAMVNDMDYIEVPEELVNVNTIPKSKADKNNEEEIELEDENILEKVAEPKKVIDPNAPIQPVLVPDKEDIAIFVLPLQLKKENNQDNVSYEAKKAVIEHVPENAPEVVPTPVPEAEAKIEIVTEPISKTMPKARPDNDTEEEIELEADETEPKANADENLLTEDNTKGVKEDRHSETEDEVEVEEVESEDETGDISDEEYNAIFKPEESKPEWVSFDNENFKIVIKVLEGEGEITCKLPRRNINKIAALMQDVGDGKTNTIAAVYQKLINNKFYGICDIDNMEYRIDNALNLQVAISEFDKIMDDLKKKYGKHI